MEREAENIIKVVVPDLKMRHTNPKRILRHKKNVTHGLDPLIIAHAHITFLQNYEGVYVWKEKGENTGGLRE